LERQKEPKNASADALYYLLEYYYFVLWLFCNQASSILLESY
jgi:hypothetical protein